jgi:hypothetical protein
MARLITFKSMPDGPRWKVTRDDQLVAHYLTQKMAERESGRLARAEARKGNCAIALFHEGDGIPKAERNYTKRHGPRLSI